MIRLFDISNKVIVPSEHCYTINYLKKIMDNYPDDHIKVYQYLHYMTCPSEEFNPYFNLSAEDREETILRDIEAGFSTEDPDIIEAIAKCEKMYETPTLRAYKGMANMMDRLAKYMNETAISHGRDGNINSLISAAKNFDAIRGSFKGVAKDLKEEQKKRAKGGGSLAYDQS